MNMEFLYNKNKWYMDGKYIGNSNDVHDIYLYSILNENHAHGLVEFVKDTNFVSVDIPISSNYCTDNNDFICNIKFSVFDATKKIKIYHFLYDYKEINPENYQVFELKWNKGYDLPKWIPKQTGKYIID